MTDLPVTDPRSPLPVGTTVLEASAGTGKTYAVETLAVRFVAEGAVPLERLLVVTFGRNATSELRERVRARFVAVERSLAAGSATGGTDEGVAGGMVGGAAAGTDPLAAALADAPPDEVRHRRERLRAAVVGFDAATVETTHGFCNRVLAGLGLAADADPAARLVEDVGDLVSEVVADVLLAEFSPAGAPRPLVTADEVRRAAREALAQPDAALAPGPGGDPPGGAPRDVTRAGGPTPAAGHARLPAAVEQRLRLVTRVRDEVVRRKRERGLRDYDDMVTDLRDALVAPGTGALARERLRRAYGVVLVDEFQDTDPVQWEILREAFHGHSTLVLVGDPKQAIYAFRGADVATYAAAVRAAPDARTLDVNRRSDRALVDAVTGLFSGVQLGPGIAVPPVRAHHDATRTRSADGAPLPPLRLRLVPRPGSRPFPVADARPLVAADVAAVLVGMLDGGTTWAGPDGVPRALTPGDAAVLVRTNDQAAAVRDRLRASGVPVTVSGAASVFLSEAAADWAALLRALEQPHRRRLVGRAALTAFVGWDAARLGTADTAALDEVSAWVRGWADVLAARGVAALLEVVTSATDLPARVLAREGGARLLTDVRHVGQALHAASLDGHAGVSALSSWLGQRIDEAAADPTEERSQRLESDARAVTVLTVHRSKGLQWPVVLVPFAWDRWVPDEPDPLHLHDADGRRVLDVGGPAGPGWGARLARHREDEEGEDLRLLYVALTRAAGHAVLWWAPTFNTPGSALQRVLFGVPEEGRLPGHVPVAPDAEVREALAGVARRSGGALRVEEATTGAPVPVLEAAGPAAGAALAERRFDRTVDTSWRRTSYTRLTEGAHERGAHDAPAAPRPAEGEPEAPARDDEHGADEHGADEHGADEHAGVTEDAGAGAGAVGPGDGGSDEGGTGSRAGDLVDVASPMAALPVGTAFGTLVHAVLEVVDPQAPHLGAEVERAVAAAAATAGAGVPPEGLGGALVACLTTPLGAVAAGRALAGIPVRDRLAEMSFELPLAGGDRPDAGGASLRAVAHLVRAWVPPGDALAAYPDALDALAAHGGAATVLRGYLTGSLDAVLRVPGPGGDERYLVVDYKTNWLGPPGEPLDTGHYRREVMAAAMVRAHYPLQALLYSVALHRFLRWRRPGYDPDVHLGGAAYLFLRGMAGPGTPVRDGHVAGVFDWRPPAGLVVGLSHLLDGRAA